MNDTLISYRTQGDGSMSCYFQKRKDRERQGTVLCLLLLKKTGDGSVSFNAKSKNVYMLGALKNKDFIKAWNSMSGEIDYVYLYLHGSKGALCFKGESLTFSGKPSFKDLKSKTVKKAIYLLSCYGGAGKEGENVAWMFAKLASTKVYAQKDGGRFCVLAKHSLYGMIFKGENYAKTSS